MNTKEKYLLKNTGILTVSNLSSKILIFLLVPLYTGVLSKAEYGTYDLAITTVYLLYPILTVNIVDAVMRFAMDKAYAPSSVAKIGWRYICTSVLCVAVIAAVFYGFNIYPKMTPYLLYTVLYYVAYTLNQFFIQLAKGLEKIAVMGVAGVIGAAVTVCANLLFLLVFRWGIDGFFAANILAQAVSAVYILLRVNFVKMLKEQGSGVDEELKKQMLAYAVPLVLTAVAWWANSFTDRYVVTLFAGLAANGLLSIAYKIPQVLNAIQAIFIQAWHVSAIKEHEDDRSEEFYGTMFLLVMTLMEAATAWILFFNRNFAKLLYANDFFAAWEFVPFLLLSSLINTAAGLLGAILAAEKNSKLMAKSAVYGLVFNLVGNFALIPFLGIQGGAIATAISSLVIFAVRIAACKGRMDTTGHWRVYVTWALLFGQAIVEISALSRWFQAGLMVVMLVLNAKILVKLVQRLPRKKVK